MTTATDAERIARTLTEAQRLVLCDIERAECDPNEPPLLFPLDVPVNTAKALYGRGLIRHDGEWPAELYVTELGGAVVDAVRALLQSQQEPSNEG